MYNEIITTRDPVRVWASLDTLEQVCLDQANHLAVHPVVSLPVALMPDAHSGYGMPIGGVIACRGAVIPNAVGVDIGCGMRFMRTSVEAPVGNKMLLRSLVDQIKSVVPVGFEHQKDPVDWEGFVRIPSSNVKILTDEYQSARKQLGTLGGGNHFIELQVSSDGKLCVMLHSGSRNFGYKICEYFNAEAIRLNALWHSSAAPEWDLAFLPIGSKECSDYIKAMNFALLFARENRRLMMEEVKKVLSWEYDTEIGFEEQLDVHHNYAALEHHMGGDYWIHRKGAIRQREGEYGIIPGSMGTKSYIVRGKGSVLSYCSASHGAGRRMSRNDAIRNFTVEQADASMGDVVHDRWNKIQKGKFAGLYNIDEAPIAYKDIEEVINNESDLVSVVDVLNPLAVVKA